MSPEIQIQNSCATILNIVRQSGSNFTIQNSNNPSNLGLQPGAFLPNHQTEQLQSHLTFIEQANDNLKHEYANAVDELEVNRNNIDEL